MSIQAQHRPSFFFCPHVADVPSPHAAPVLEARGQGAASARCHLPSLSAIWVAPCSPTHPIVWQLDWFPVVTRLGLLEGKSGARDVLGAWGGKLGMLWSRRARHCLETVLRCIRRRDEDLGPCVITTAAGKEENGLLEAADRSLSLALSLFLRPLGLRGCWEAWPLVSFPVVPFFPGFSPSPVCGLALVLAPFLRRGNDVRA